MTLCRQRQPAAVAGALITTTLVLVAAGAAQPHVLSVRSMLMSARATANAVLAAATALLESAQGSAESTFECLPALRCQLSVLAVLVLGLALSLVLGGALFYHLLRNHPSKPRVVARMQHDLKKEFNCEMSEEQLWRLFCELFVIGIQHLSGGLLILPALLRIGDPAVTQKLAMVGALSEVSYDLWDSVRAVYRHYVTHSLPGGRRALIFVLLHHQMAIALVLPMNSRYSSNRLYLHMVFNLMGAGGFALFVSHAGQMLNLATRRDLLVMRALATAQFGIMAYTRVLAYVPLAVCLLYTVAQDGAWALFGVGLVALGTMAFFNAILLPSGYRRMMKFFAMSAGDPEEHHAAKEAEVQVSMSAPNGLTQPDDKGMDTSGLLVRVLSTGMLQGAEVLDPTEPLVDAASSPSPSSAAPADAVAAADTSMETSACTRVVELAQARSVRKPKAAEYARGLLAKVKGIRHRRGAGAGASASAPPGTGLSAAA